MTDSVESKIIPEDLNARTLRYCEEDAPLKLAVAAGIAAVHLCRIAENFVEQRLHELGCEFVPEAFSLIAQGVRAVGSQPPKSEEDLASRVLNYAVPFLALVRELRQETRGECPPKS